MDLSATERPSHPAADAGSDDVRSGATSIDKLGRSPRHVEIGRRPSSFDLHPRHRSKLRIGLAIGVATYALLLVYGVASRHGGDSGKNTVTVRVPAPAQGIAAIKALPPPNLLKPLTPSEAAKENSDRPFVGRPDSPAARFVLKTDAEDRTRAVTCLAQAVYYEAAGEGVDGGRAVAQVVLNRVRHPGFPSTICGVVYEGADRPTGCQFSFTCDGSMQRIPYPTLWTRSKKIAEEALKGHVFAAVGHATHYHADYVLPYWADALDKSAQVGRHIFYRLRNSLGEARAFSQHYGGLEPPVRQPGATIVIPQTPEGQELAAKLIEGVRAGGVDKTDAPPPKPAIPLIIDQSPSMLVADGDNRPQLPRRAKPSSNCPGNGEGKQLSPLRANDMRSEANPSNC